jgi:hypothetical protein
MTRMINELLEGLKGSPVLLALISLNVIMVGGALWFLRALAAAQSARFDLLMRACKLGNLP